MNYFLLINEKIFGSFLKVKYLLFIFGLGLSSLITLSEMNSSIEPFDTGLYHVHSIEYFKNGLNVIGLGNINFRLSFTNFFFAFIGIVERIIPDIKSYYIFIPFIYFCIIYYIFYTIINLYFKKRIDFRFYYSAILFIFMINNPLFIVSVSPDSFSTYCTIGLVSFIVFSDRINKFYFTVLYISILFLITVKITNLLILLLLVPSFFNLKKKLNIFTLLVIAVMIFLPWFTISVMTSGFLVYPILKMPFVNFEWTLMDGNAISLSQIVRGWARMPNEYWINSLDEPTTVWIANWFNLYFDNNIHNFQNLVYIYATFIFLFFGCIIFKLCSNKLLKNSLEAKKRTLKYLLLLLISIGFWFYSSPDPRFAYGTLIIFPILGISLILDNLVCLSLKYRISLKNICLTALVLFAVCKIDYEILMNLNFGQKYPIVEGEYKTNNNDFTYFLPEKGVCWNYTIFCAPDGAENIIKIPKGNFFIIKHK